MPLMRLVYFSENQLDPAAGPILRSLRDILSTSKRNNEPSGLTGALVFDGMWFLQALEGDRQTVWKTFQRIHDDERHANVVIAEFVEVKSRLFGNWWMGLATRSANSEHIFRAFLDKGNLNPRVMSAKQMLSLMMALSEVGFSRELNVTQAA